MYCIKLKKPSIKTYHYLHAIKEKMPSIVRQIVLSMIINMVKKMPIKSMKGGTFKLLWQG